MQTIAADILELSLVFHDYINQLYYSSSESELNGNNYDSSLTAVEFYISNSDI